MKIRKGFVSNSSSSSFIVIEGFGHSYDFDCYKDIDTLIVDNNFGETDFGWQVDEYYDTGSKIIFSYLQAQDSGDKKKQRMDMLENVIKDNFGVRHIIWDLDDAYIDHQSSASKGENTEMFCTENTLFTFLFSDDSYIRTDNDNY